VGTQFSILDLIGLAIVTTIGVALSAAAAQSWGPVAALTVAGLLSLATVIVIYQVGIVGGERALTRLLPAVLLIPLIVSMFVIPSERAAITNQTEYADQVAAFGEAHFQELDVNTDGDVCDDELEAYLAKPGLSKVERQCARHALDYIGRIGHTVDIYYIGEVQFIESGISREDFRAYPSKVRTSLRNWR